MAYDVNADCIACDTCTGLAPENFALTQDYKMAYVTHQPKNPEQNQRCEEALAACPVGAILKC